MFRILYWNVWCLPGPFTDKRYSSDERAKLIAPHIRGYDLVLLNEAWTPEAKRVFKKEYPYYYKTGSQCFATYDSGLLVLSKHPIRSPSYHLFSKAAGWDWFASKGVIHFELQIKLNTYHFFLTHMQAGHSHADQVARFKQTDELIDYVNRHLRNGESAFLIGDLNMMPIVDGEKSVHTEDLNDARLRERAYNLISERTGLIEINHYPLDVYHIFTNLTDGLIQVGYYDSNQLSDGPYLTIEFPL